jgi:hypothetical protein
LVKRRSDNQPFTIELFGDLLAYMLYPPYTVGLIVSFEEHCAQLDDLRTRLVAGKRIVPPAGYILFFLFHFPFSS